MLSDENINNGNNINAKHTRLISDYKSLRDKHNLLKNALIVERDRTKELESLISDSDMQKRKSFQEQESLIFRNDLLTKQLNSLRDELERERLRKNRKASVIKGKESSPTNEEVEVIKEELINKITECSSLHSQLSSQQFEHQMETNNFRSAINDLENQLRLVNDQNKLVEMNIRKTLAKEMEERTVLENKLEQKDNLTAKLERSEQNLKGEIKSLKVQLTSRILSSPTNLDNPDFITDKSDQRTLLTDLENVGDCVSLVDSLKSKDTVDIKRSNSLNNSLVSLPNDGHLSSNEIYLCSLLDKIRDLEQKINSLELTNQITEKRMKIEKMHRDFYESFIIQNGFELPQPCSKKDCTSPSEEQSQPDSVYDTMSQFYENKFISLNKQIYQAIAKASIYYDEVRTLDCRLESARIERDNSRSEMELLKQQIRTSQEDLDLTRTQYDNKMRTMSIHIAELSGQLENEKHWAQQQQPVYGDHVIKGHENVSSIKNFINSLKK